MTQGTTVIVTFIDTILRQLLSQVDESKSMIDTVVYVARPELYNTRYSNYHCTPY